MMIADGMSEVEVSNIDHEMSEFFSSADALNLSKQHCNTFKFKHSSPEPERYNKKGISLKGIGNPESYTVEDHAPDNTPLGKLCNLDKDLCTYLVVHESRLRCFESMFRDQGLKFCAWRREIITLPNSSRDLKSTIIFL